MRPQAFPQRVLRDERLELGDKLLMLTQHQACLAETFDRVEAQTVQSSRLPLRPRCALEVGQRRSAPPLERFGQSGRDPLRCKFVGTRDLRERAFETYGVDVVRRDLEQIAPGTCLQRPGREALSQLVHVRLQRRRRRFRRALPATGRR